MASNHTFTPKEIVTQKVAQLAQQPHDFFCVTDGSGYTDEFGGFCGIGWEPGASKPLRYCCGGQFGTDVFRMEFTALLEVLAGFVTHLNAWSDHGRSALAARPKSVLWRTDNEALSLSVFRDYSVRERTVYYSRSSVPDLWARFHFFEPLFRITPVWVDRESSIMRAVDHHASSLRSFIKSYCEMYPLQDTFHHINA